jgi:hypothetical protein
LPPGIDPADVDPVRVLASIAADSRLPAAARVAACKTLLKAGLGGSGHNGPPAAPDDALNRRTLALMGRRGKPN